MRLTIEINGVSYPCYSTMGAMLRFKQETGREVTEMSGGLSDMCCYLYCCCVSACKREGVEFPFPTLLEFADSLPEEALTRWQQGLSGEQNDADGEKKSR